MYRFKEGELPILAIPTVNTKNLDRLRAVLVGPEGQLFIPHQRVGPNTIEYSCVEGGLDVAIRQRKHIYESVNNGTEKQLTQALLINDLNQFNRRATEILGRNAKTQGKFFELQWFYEQTNECEHYHGVVSNEVATIVDRASRIKARPYLEAATETIQLARCLPTRKEMGEATYEAWEDFVSKGRGIKVFSRIYTTLDKTLEEHSDPTKCCIRAVESKIAA